MAATLYSACCGAAAGMRRMSSLARLAEPHGSFSKKASKKAVTSLNGRFQLNSTGSQFEEINFNCKGGGGDSGSLMKPMGHDSSLGTSEWKFGTLEEQKKY
jgi:hypothetical protein